MLLLLLLALPSSTSQYVKFSVVSEIARLVYCWSSYNAAAAALAYIILHFIVVHEICVNSSPRAERMLHELARLIRQQPRQQQQHHPSGLKYLWLAILCTIIYASVCL